MSNRQNGTLGVTSDLIKRIYQHKNKLMEGLTSKYRLDKLVYYEIHDDIEASIQREKNIKFWKRSWKIDLIESINPSWHDIYETLLRDAGVKHQHDEEIV